MEAAWEELTITELARKYGLHTNQIRGAWKEQLLWGAVGRSGVEVQRDQDDLVRDLHAAVAAGFRVQSENPELAAWWRGRAGEAATRMW